MEKLLTICTAAYNAEQYVEQMIESVAGSKYFEQIEMIIVNDGSTDDTSKLLHQYEQRHSKSILVIDKENGGPGSARNVAFKLAKGKYIKIIDIDDKVDTTNLDLYLEYLQTLDADMIINPHYYYYASDPAEIFIENNYENWEENIYDINKNLPEIKQLSMHDVTYRTSVIQDNAIRLSERILYDDMEYLSLPIPYVELMAFINIPYYIYQLGIKGQSVDPNVAICKQEHRNIIIERLVKVLAENQGKPSNAIIKNNLFRVCRDSYYVYLAVNGFSYEKNLKEFDRFIKNISKPTYDDLGKIYRISFLRFTDFKGYYVIRILKSICDNLKKIKNHN